ncbi:RCC1 domain-containing protein [Actinokineospora spheciospongiae]|uniref:RCC1 domain-containing protein n=1 Tax=Actinokineospora spheciospongiae TaxID=909613 RepID=UPI0011B85917|nr:hypothetical protein [Actinokineospora spheciospongiae]
MVLPRLRTGAGAAVLVAAVATALVPGVAQAGPAGNQAVGQVIAWGDSDYGQTTVPAAASSGVSAISAGYFHGLALKNGGVLAWGLGAHGQTTVPAAATSGVTGIAAGLAHSLALKNGGVIAWGGQFSTGGGSPVAVPAAATSGVVSVAAGFDTSAALKSDGTMIAWGVTMGSSFTLTGVKSIEVNYVYVTAVKNDGTILSWTSSSSPVTLPPTTGLPIKQAVHSEGRGVGLTNDGHAFSWDLTGATTALPSALVAGNTAVDSGDRQRLFLRSNSVVAIDTNNNPLPVPAAATSGVVAISGGHDHGDVWAMALK